jgi:hypothetical protein
LMMRRILFTPDWLMFRRRRSSPSHIAAYMTTSIEKSKIDTLVQMFDG